MTVKIYTATHCVPCHEVVEALMAQGFAIDGEPVEIVDVETEEGFNDLNENVLSAMDDDIEIGVPLAIKDGKRCLLDLTEGKVSLTC